MPFSRPSAKSICQGLLGVAHQTSPHASPVQRDESGIPAKRTKNPPTFHASEIRRSPVEAGSWNLPLFTTGFSTIPGGFLAGFLPSKKILIFCGLGFVDPFNGELAGVLKHSFRSFLGLNTLQIAVEFGSLLHLLEDVSSNLIIQSYNGHTYCTWFCFADLASRCVWTLTYTWLSTPKSPQCLNFQNLDRTIAVAEVCPVGTGNVSQGTICQQPGHLHSLKISKNNIDPENRPSQKETIVFQPSIFKCLCC